MSDEFEYDDEPDIDIIAGRELPPGTMIQDWVMLADVSAEAKAAYAILQMHVNRQRGDGKVWPSTRAIAKLLMKSRGDKISAPLKELAAIEAIDIRHGRSMPRRNVYIVHQRPPEGYQGPLNLKEWYAANRPALNEAKLKDKIARDARKKKKQVSAVTPKTGEQEQEIPVTPDSGQHVAPKTREHVAPNSGREPNRSKNQEEKNPPPPPAEVATGSSEAGVRDRGEDLPPEQKTQLTMDRVLDYFASLPVAKLRNWNRVGVEGALRAAMDQGRGDLATCARALRILAKGEVYGETRSPRRLLESGRWWQDANPPAGTTPPGIPRQTAKCDRHPSEPAHNCGLCRAEALGADRDDDRPVPGVSREEADARSQRWINGRRGTRVPA